RGVAAGHVFEPGGQAERAGGEVGFQQSGQSRDLRGRGFAGAVVDAREAAQRAVAGGGGDVDVGGRARHRLEPGGQAGGGAVAGRRAAAVLPEYDGGGAHREVAGVGLFERVAVRVQVDEAGRQHAAAAFDDARAARRTR